MEKHNLLDGKRLLIVDDEADIRISLKKRGGPTHRIKFIRQPMGRRYWVRRDGKYSTKVPEATATQIAERIRRWLVANT